MRADHLLEEVEIVITRRRTETIAELVSLRL
jgi:hypothetical protein